LGDSDRVIVPGVIGGLKVVAAGCAIVLILGLGVLFAFLLTHPSRSWGRVVKTRLPRS
jgi:hypothetical protein